jgi:hypothetical protein
VKAGARQRERQPWRVRSPRELRAGRRSKPPVVEWRTLVWSKPLKSGALLEGRIVVWWIPEVLMYVGRSRANRALGRPLRWQAAAWLVFGLEGRFGGWKVRGSKVVSAAREL